MPPNLRPPTCVPREIYLIFVYLLRSEQSKLPWDRPWLGANLPKDRSWISLDSFQAGGTCTCIHPLQYVLMLKAHWNSQDSTADTVQMAWCRDFWVSSFNWVMNVSVSVYKIYTWANRPGDQILKDWFWRLMIVLQHVRNKKDLLFVAKHGLQVGWMLLDPVASCNVDLFEPTGPMKWNWYPVVLLPAIPNNGDEVPQSLLGWDAHIHKSKMIASWELTYPTYGRGKSASRIPLKGIC